MHRQLRLCLPFLRQTYILFFSAGELNSDELERLVTIIQNPTQFKIPTWFLNRQRDIVDGKNFQVLSNGVDSKLRDDLERLKKIRAHRGLRHSWGLRVRGQHTKTTGAFLIFSSAISRSDQVSLFRPSWKDCRCVEEARLDSVLLGKGWFPVDPVFVLHTLCYAFHYVHDSVSTGGNAYIFATPLIKDSGEDRTAQGEVGRMSRDGTRPANVDSRRFMPPTAYIISSPKHRTFVYIQYVRDLGKLSVTPPVVQDVLSQTQAFF